MSSNNDKWVFILNPVAGGGLAKKYRDKIIEKIKTHKLKAELVSTEYKGHATTIASDFAERGYNHIIAVGGDGTLNEIVRGIVDQDFITLGIIAAGTVAGQSHGYALLT